MTTYEAISKYNEMMKEAIEKAEYQGWPKNEVFDFLFGAADDIKEEILKEAEE